LEFPFNHNVFNQPVEVISGEKVRVLPWNLPLIHTPKRNLSAWGSRNITLPTINAGIKSEFKLMSSNESLSLSSIEKSELLDEEVLINELL
jgi:hypothetical protein